MKYFTIQLTACSLLLILIFSSVALLSGYQHQKIKELQKCSEDLPTTLENSTDLLEKATILEEKLKKAGTSLAFFTHYEQLNAAFLSAASLRAAIEGNSPEQYGRALCELKEALGTLERNESFSLEVII